MSLTGEMHCQCDKLEPDHTRTQDHSKGPKNWGNRTQQGLPHTR